MMYKIHDNKSIRFIEYISKMKTTTKQMKINVLFYSYL